MRRLLIKVAITISAMATAHADPNVSWDVTISSGTPPPPVVRNEASPSPRPSHVWVQGYWGLHGNDYTWVPGRWEPARRGYVYVQPQWREGPRGWEFREGGWREGGRSSSDGPGHCPPGHRRKGEC